MLQQQARWKEWSSPGIVVPPRCADVYLRHGPQRCKVLSRFFRVKGSRRISRKTVLLLNGRSEALFLGRCYGRVKDNIWNPSLSRPLAMLAARVQPDVDASALVLILEASSGWASPQTGRYFGSGSTRPLAGESYRPALCNRTSFPSACAAFTTSF